MNLHVAVFVFSLSGQLGDFQLQGFQRTELTAFQPAVSDSLPPQGFAASIINGPLAMLVSQGNLELWSLDEVRILGTVYDFDSFLAENDDSDRVRIRWLEPSRLDHTFSLNFKSGHVLIFDPSTWERPLTTAIPKHLEFDSYVSFVRFLDDSRLLVVLTGDRFDTARIYRLSSNTPELIREFRLPCRVGHVCCVAEKNACLVSEIPVVARVGQPAMGLRSRVFYCDLETGKSRQVTQLALDGRLRFWGPTVPGEFVCRNPGPSPGLIVGRSDWQRYVPFPDSIPRSFAQVNINAVLGNGTAVWSVDGSWLACGRLHPVSTHQGNTYALHAIVPLSNPSSSKFIPNYVDMYDGGRSAENVSSISNDGNLLLATEHFYENGEFFLKWVLYRSQERLKE